MIATSAEKLGLNKAPIRTKKSAVRTSEQVQSDQRRAYSGPVDFVFCCLVRTVIQLLRVVPLTLIALLGRAFGELFYWVDARHRKVAIKNISLCFGEKSQKEIRWIARENFRRIGESFASAIKCAPMDRKHLRGRLDVTAPKELTGSDPLPQSRLLALGHFGNFEALARIQDFLPSYRFGVTYRGLRQVGLERIMKSLRQKSGCRFFERRTQSEEFRRFLRNPGVLVGLLADQHAGKNGLRLPFMGRECSTSAAPALFALRFKYPLHVAICYRVGLAKWHMDFSKEIPTWEKGAPRTVEAIMTDVNALLEEAVRRDPANWFWVHNRWKA